LSVNTNSSDPLFSYPSQINALALMTRFQVSCFSEIGQLFLSHISIPGSVISVKIFFILIPIGGPETKSEASPTRYIAEDSVARIGMPGVFVTGELHEGPDISLQLKYRGHPVTGNFSFDDLLLRIALPFALANFFPSFLVSIVSPRIQG
jgi:hypothetical protein